jgi:microcystin-dependent protein
MSKARQLADSVTGNFAFPIGALANAPNPIQAGTIAFLGMPTAPSGWLKANGAAISRTTYADLFSAIGTTFGSGDGSTTFNLPDLRGEFPRGLDDGRGVDSGRALGSAQADEIKSHTHFGGNFYSNGGYGAGWHTLKAYSDTHETTATGGAETRPRNIALLACIKY